MHEYCLRQVFGISQLFCLRDSNGSPSLLVAKVVDDFLIIGLPGTISAFLDALKGNFELGAISTDKDMRFLGCDIRIRGDDSVRLSMDNYLDKIHPVDVLRARRHNPHELVDSREISEYRHVAGMLVYMGQAVLPQTSFVASKMQQKLGKLQVCHLLDANRMLSELKSLEPSIVYRVPEDPINVTLASFSDASHGGVDYIYGQSGFVSVLRIRQENGEVLFHCLTWSSSKQKCTSYSSYGAEIHAAANADDRGFDLKASLLALFPNRPVKHELLVDSKSLFETITTLHDSREYRLRKTVARMRDSFESSELNVVRWIPGSKNIADALTMHTPNISMELNKWLSSGTW